MVYTGKLYLETTGDEEVVWPPAVPRLEARGERREAVVLIITLINTTLLIENTMYSTGWVTWRLA